MSRKRCGPLTSAAISTTIASILREHYGRGPMKAKTYVLDDLVVVVLNASGVNGRAAATATQLQGLGYAKVTTGTIAQVTGTSVLYAEGAKAGGDQLAADLQLQTVAPLAGNPAETAAAAAQLVVVLGK